MTAPTAYDTVAYPSSIFSQTHPDRLAAIARLHGLKPPEIATARVLEIGGGEGMNAIALAAAYPRLRVLSFDLSPQAVARGKLAVEKAGLANVQVEVGDILDAAQDLTQTFDYVICHGVYAWVPEVVRDAILRLTGRVLADNGVAYISYNALPGGYLRIALRDMLLRAVAGVEDPQARLAAAHAFLDAYIAQGTDDDRPPQKALIDEARTMRTKSASVLFHDELGECFFPQALSDVARSAEAHGLQFLGDAGEGPLGDGFLPDGADDVSTPAVVRAAQVQDDRNVRFFRQSLFVRAAQRPLRQVDPDLIRTLYVSSNASRSGENGYKNKSGIYEMSDPRMIAVMERLIGAFPDRVPMADLDADDEVTRALHGLFEAGLVQLHAGAPPFAVTQPARPEASSLARAQLEDGQVHICTLDHHILAIREPAPAAFIRMLDGTRTLDDLRAHWAQTEFAQQTSFDAAMALVIRAAFLKLRVR